MARPTPIKMAAQLAALKRRAERLVADSVAARAELAPLAPRLRAAAGSPAYPVLHAYAAQRFSGWIALEGAARRAVDRSNNERLQAALDGALAGATDGPDESDDRADGGLD